MDQKQILSLAVDILQAEDDFVMPVIKLLEMIFQEQPAGQLNQSTFEKWLAADPRFKLYQDVDPNAWPDSEDADMRELGYYKGPRVMLVSRTPTKEELIASMARKMQKTINSLKIAYQTKPDDLPPEQEEEFLRVMAKTKELQQQLEDSFEPEN